MAGRRGRSAPAYRYEVTARFITDLVVGDAKIAVTALLGGGEEARPLELLEVPGGRGGRHAQPRARARPLRESPDIKAMTIYEMKSNTARLRASSSRSGRTSNDREVSVRTCAKR